MVTGHDANGKAVFASDEQVDGIRPALVPGYEFHRLWGADQAPTFPDDGSAPPPGAYFPPVGGFRFGLFTVPAGSTVLDAELDMEAALGDLEARLPGMASHMEPDHPGMHTTDTVDFEYVISGEVVLELDDGATRTLRPGDTVVQNGTRHAWRNVGTEPCQMVVVLVGAHRR